jgi:hypothetical protein
METTERECFRGESVSRGMLLLDQSGAAHDGPREERAAR